jgi:hypothetical protein
MSRYLAVDSGAHVSYWQCAIGGARVYYLVLLAVVGTKAHKTVMNAIIEMRLCAMNEQLHEPQAE